MAVYDARGVHPGPTVVLVHGVASRASQYAPVATALLSWCGRVVIPDLIGHGESELPPDGIRVDTIREALTTAAGCQRPKVPRARLGSADG